MATFYPCSQWPSAFAGGATEPLGDYLCVVYTCPLCKRGHAPPPGQSLVYLAHLCVDGGEELTECASCHKPFRTPSSIFVPDLSLSLKNAGRLHWPEHIGSLSQEQLLVPDWEKVIEAANSACREGAAVPWDGQGPCPICGNPQSVSISFPCVWCSKDLSLNQGNVSQTGQTRIACPHCQRTIIVPSTVWCQVCHRNLRHSSVLRDLVQQANAKVFDAAASLNADRAKPSQAELAPRSEPSYPRGDIIAGLSISGMALGLAFVLIRHGVFHWLLLAFGTLMACGAVVNIAEVLLKRKRGSPNKPDAGDGK